MKAPLWTFVIVCALAVSGRALDLNGNQQSDVWEMIFGASGLPAAGDADGDGWSNALESAAGTNPRDGASFPGLHLTTDGVSLFAGWTGLAGKKYTLETKPALGAGTWTALGPDMLGEGGPTELQLAPGGAPTGFFRLRAADVDSDGDGISDWEERALGFDAARTRTERSDTLDSARIPAGLTAANTITVGMYDDTCSERWPDPAVLVVRRAGGLQPLTVNVAFSGTATRGPDYTTSSTGNVVTLGPGQREAFVEIQPVADANDGEPTETITLTVLAGAGYSVGAQNAGTVSLFNETAASGPSRKEAARFLIQAAFGPDQDTNGNHIPENVEELMGTTFGAWIDDQFARPIGLLRPMVQWQAAQPGSAEIYNDTKQNAWWGRAMGVPKLRPDAAASQLPDPLRQRVGFALSQIYVISDRMETLATNPEGMAAYYDMLLTRAFGNFRDLLYDVSVHPCMGLYLSHLGNRKPDPVAKTFPDENYAREVMQLFSIGLWMLNPDGSRQLDAQGQPIPTYSNANITEFARVFTGLSHWDSDFGGYSTDFTKPMIAFDEEHDLGPKTLLLGTTTPQRTAHNLPNSPYATLLDVDAAIDNLFNHPNAGPFLARQLIQRLITSNPSPAYIGRVSAKFANNGAGVRGDMQAVVKQILLDPEARDGVALTNPTFGKLREPFLKCVNFARAFNAASQEGWYYLDAFNIDHVEEPLKSPSVFNFYLPAYAPPGALTQAGLVAPELQIINASSGVKAPNYFFNAIEGGLHRWGTAQPERVVKLNLTTEMLLNAGVVPPDEHYPPGLPNPDPDLLIRRLDLALTGGTLAPRNFQLIREAMLRIFPGGYDWHIRRLQLGIYLITTSADFAVQR
ncbi:MAG: DUF1800 family protein [Chthoniobacter sp.]|nr:DUF1800 family protein [Chthoniobacter sp.]